MTDSKQTIFDRLVAHFREATLLQTAADTLEWDERTGMPIEAGEYRASQVTLLRGMVHSRRTDPQVGEWLSTLADWDLASDLETTVGTTIARMRHDYERDCRLPQQLVEALANATVRGQQAWDRARQADRFADFVPALQQIVALKREAAGCLAHDGQTLYEALLDEYEPGAKVADLKKMFSDLREQLVDLLQTLQDAPRKPPLEILQREYPLGTQRTFSRLVAERVGYDFQRGRLDETSHPFCTSLGPDDCRILTRYHENWFPAGLFGTLHEAGHGMYDQGLNREWYGLPPGSFVSLGIHESQSRLWENLVGRSKGFWDFFYPLLHEAFPVALEDVTREQFHFAVNSVQPSLIRVEADEATYNLHIIVRFELEQALLAGELEVSELPAAWNAQYEEVLGIKPATDAMGVLQDVHWSAGLIGYFPTYTLGNLYAAELYQAAERELGSLQQMFAEGEFVPLLRWLREKIHRHGRTFAPADLIRRATGVEPSGQPLIDSLRSRYLPLYGIS